MSTLNQERVLDVRHWTEDLFSFKVTRDSAFRFVNGQFTMIGIEIEGRHRAAPDAVAAAKARKPPAPKAPKPRKEPPVVEIPEIPPPLPQPIASFTF